jgi:hypothetical protein
VRTHPVDKLLKQHWYKSAFYEDTALLDATILCDDGIKTANVERIGFCGTLGNVNSHKSIQYVNQSESLS